MDLEFVWISFNRTTVECKWDSGVYNKNGGFGFNRTTVECKCVKT